MARVLVVDDDAAQGSAIARMLRRAGYEVQAMTEPLLVRAELDGLAWDVLLVDVSMPDVTGPDLVEELRAAGTPRRSF